MLRSFTSAWLGGSSRRPCQHPSVCGGRAGLRVKISITAMALAPSWPSPLRRCSATAGALAMATPGKLNWNQQVFPSTSCCIPLGRFHLDQLLIDAWSQLKRIRLTSPSGMNIVIQVAQVADGFIILIAKLQLQKLRHSFHRWISLHSFPSVPLGLLYLVRHVLQICSIDRSKLVPALLQLEQWLRQGCLTKKNQTRQ